MSDASSAEQAIEPSRRANPRPLLWLAFVALVVCLASYFNTKLGMGQTRSWVEIAGFKLNRFWMLIWSFFLFLVLIIRAGVLIQPAMALARKCFDHLEPFLRAVGRIFAEPLTYIAIVTVSLLVGYTMFEIYFRNEIALNYMNGDYPAIIYTEAEGRDSVGYPTIPQALEEELKKPNPHIGHFKQDRNITLWFYDRNHTLKQEVNFHTNNLGFLSKKDYVISRNRPEYRIAVLGDSMTGSTTTNNPWVDRLEDLLGADDELMRHLGGRQVKVLNIGQPGAGFPHFAFNYRMQAKLFDPDLVIINYIESDFPRQAAPKPKRDSRVIGGWIEYPARNGTADTAKLNVTCEEPPVSLSNPLCRQTYFFVMPKSLASDAEAVRRIKTAVVRDYLRGQLWISPYPFGLMKALGYKVDLTAFRNPEVFHIPELNESDMVAQARKHLRDILDDHPNVLITLNPIYTDFAPGDPYKKTQLLLASDPKMDIVIMRNFMPRDRGEEEIYRWYNLPHDGHFSDYGAGLYAKAMAGVVKRRILRGSSPRRPHLVNVLPRRVEEARSHYCAQDSRFDSGSRNYRSTSTM